MMLIDRKDRYMFLKLICVISMTVAFFNTIALILYKRQVKSICRQIRFLNENNSNLEITKDIGSKEIDELVDTLNDFLENFKNEKIKINEKDLKLREIVTNISHDIRTPLTSLNGYFELLGQAEDEKEYERYVQIIKERIDCLKEMLEQLFTYVKLQNDEYQFDYEEFDVCKELCSTLIEFYEVFHKRGIEPKVEVPDEAVSMKLNKLAFRRVFENIIKNSIEHGNEKFELKMVHCPAGNHDETVGEKLIESSNINLDKNLNKNGIVIIIKNDLGENYIKNDEVDIDRVFERFYKADKSRSQNSTGLGLAIARDMVIKMKGNIKAEIEDDFFVIKVELF